MSPFFNPSTTKRRRRRDDQRGVALVMVLGALVVLAVFMMEVQGDSSASLAAAMAERDALRAEYHARSAINLARLLIGTEPTIRRAVAPIFMMLNPKGQPPQIPVWAFADQVLGLFNDSSGAEAFQGLATVDSTTATNVGLGADGHFTVAIVDEDSKINVNVAARGDVISQTGLAQQLMGLLGPPQYNPLFENPDPDEQYSDRMTICAALMDWADLDENLASCDVTAQGPVSAGTEDNYYQVIGLPYLRKNAPYDSLDELRLVRGVGDDFWATFVDPEPDSPDKRILTVWGQGKVNVNTANAITLLALACAGAPEAKVCLDPLQAEAFVSAVTLARTFTMGAPLFGSPNDFVNAMEGKGGAGQVFQLLGVEPIVFRSRNVMKGMVATESKMFSIYADGVIPGQKHETHVRVHAVVDFRQASAIPTATASGSGTGTQGTQGTTPLQPTAPGNAQGSTTTQELTPEQLAAALVSNPAGQVVYWRIE
jgi:general secretion pathway protein K